MVVIKYFPVPGSYYNIGGEKALKVGQILKDLINLSSTKDIEYEVEQDRLRPIDADLQIPNISKFVKKTNWTPEINYERTIEDLLNYWRAKSKNKGIYF